MLLNALLDPLTDRETGLTDQRLIDASDMVTDMTATLREIIYDFRPAVLDDFGLLPAIRSLGEKIAKLTEFSIAVQGEDSMQRLPDFEEISLYRIVQEALTNIAKHAKAQNVLIRMLQSGTNLMLDITDDGVGFDAAHSGHLMEPGTWGLLNMRERAEAIGGTLQIESKRGFGTRVAVHIRR
jgi:signal transduction histidine kinase